MPIIQYLFIPIIVKYAYYANKSPSSGQLTSRIAIRARDDEEEGEACLCDQPTTNS